MKESLTRKIFTSDNINWREERQSRDDEIERKETWWRRLRVRWIRETVLSALKTRTRSLQSPYSKRKKICCLWNEGIHFLVPKLANQFISFSSVVYNCWSQSTRSKAISVFVLFTEVAPSIHLEKWMKLDWLPQDPQFFSQDGPESLSMEFGPYGAIPFFCIMQKKENVFFFLNGLSFCIWLSPLDTFQ